jgi:hypothetical protein
LNIRLTRSICALTVFRHQSSSTIARRTAFSFFGPNSTASVRPKCSHTTDGGVADEAVLVVLLPLRGVVLFGPLDVGE